jgi:hypothetical protein
MCSTCGYCIAWHRGDDSHILCQKLHALAISVNNARVRGHMAHGIGGRTEFVQKESWSVRVQTPIPHQYPNMAAKACENTFCEK